ncbi:TetR/AcrR family transcriptional regulator [Paenibacillus sp. IB182496]|uniref:TetR/AcrR family transcriptional regulator n=1 Tax=Paenibacillus sabuli TaxID=2772509 RepID=A0A927BQA4_9BACL|nr:TetR/AcrR family transcriptional regulator [Paenibacillus sabuli]MBD2843785.1 TetR/AcrR family transcriptional regulator [Paenibacillus sabuli]
MNHVQDLAERKKMGTRDRMLHAAIDLISAKGYKNVTIEEIAKEADVSAMTVFRHFGNKMNMLEEAVDRFYYPIPVQKIFEERMTYELRSDLRLICEIYYELMRQNVKLVHIAYKEGQAIPGLLEWVSRHPRQLKELMMEYIQRMQELGKVKAINTFKVESHALMFIALHYGSILARTFVEGNRVSFLTDQEIIDESVELFYNALTV